MGGAARHAIITGGSSGIGLALARQLVAGGYNVSLIARRNEQLAVSAAALSKTTVRSGQVINFHPADVSNRADAEKAVERSLSCLGAPDLLITSAGVAVPGYFSERPVADFEQAMAVNYFGTLYVIRAALPAMRARQAGRIVLISSGAALMGIFGYSSYGPSKFAVRGLAETLRAELRTMNIGVSVVYPPDTETPMLDAENLTKPEETKLITGLAKTWTADAVASFVIRGLGKGKFSITPGATITLMHHFPGAVIPLLRWYADHLVTRAHRKRIQDQGQAFESDLQLF
jgi:3-dehydrosphinganine reductase